MFRFHLSYVVANYSTVEWPAKEGHRVRERSSGGIDQLCRPKTGLLVNIVSLFVQNDTKWRRGV